MQLVRAPWKKLLFNPRVWPSEWHAAVVNLTARRAPPAADDLAKLFLIRAPYKAAAYNAPLSVCLSVCPPLL